MTIGNSRRDIYREVHYIFDSIENTWSIIARYLTSTRIAWIKTELQ